jgi:hypothetical protein
MGKYLILAGTTIKTGDGVSIKLAKNTEFEASDHVRDPVNITSMSAEKWKQYAPVTNRTFKSDVDCFNDLCKIPEEHIDLGDGRVLRVKSWHPEGDMDIAAETDNYAGFLPVTVTGLIARKKKP